MILVIYTAIQNPYVKRSHIVSGLGLQFPLEENAPAVLAEAFGDPAHGASMSVWIVPGTAESASECWS